MMRGLLDCASPAPHAGLGLAAYTQFTSPIRRWGDLVVHWQVKAWVRAAGGVIAGGGGGDVPPSSLPFTTPDALSAAVLGPASTARELAGLERGAEAAWLARFFAAGDAAAAAATPATPRAVYGATLLSWLRPDAGIAKVLLDGLGVEGVAVLGGPAEVGGALSLAWTGLGSPSATRPPDLRFEDWPPAGSVAAVVGGQEAGVAAVPAVAVAAAAAAAELEEEEGEGEEDE
jgi:exoribonuclease-2